MIFASWGSMPEPRKAVTRERLVAIHRVHRERAPMVAAVLLSLATAESGDRIDGVVAPDAFENQ